jgi:plasmid stabilization system protein ParE
VHRVDWSASALEDIETLLEYLAEHASPWDALKLCNQLVQSTEKLTEFPRLYEAAPQYGEGVRRISLFGQHVLYEVDDPAQTVTVLAVVGQRQDPWRVW